MFFTVIAGADALENQTSDISGINWGNLAATLRWNHIFGAKLFTNTTLYLGSYNYRFFFTENSWESGIGTLSLKSDFTHFINPNLKTIFGLELSGYGFNPGSISSGSLISILPKINKSASQKRVLYYQAE